MSMKLMYKAWGTPLKGNDLLVLLALADWANDDGECFPKQETILKRAKIGRTTLNNILNDFEDLGLIQRETRRKKSGDFGSTVYVLNLEIDFENHKNIKKNRRLNNSKNENVNTPKNAKCEHAKRQNVNTPTIYLTANKNVQPEKELDDTSQKDMNVAKYLYKQVLSKFPSTKKPNFTKWAEYIRLMRTEDNRELRHIVAVIEIVFDGNEYYNDPFWQQNIRCTQKLRKHFDVILFQINEQRMKAVS